MFKLFRNCRFLIKITNDPSQVLLFTLWNFRNEFLFLSRPFDNFIKSFFVIKHKKQTNINSVLIYIV